MLSNKFKIKMGLPDIYIRRVLRTHCYTTIILPTRNETVYRIRKAAQPEESQSKIYLALGIDWKSLPVTKTKYQR